METSKSNYSKLIKALVNLSKTLLSMYALSISTHILILILIPTKKVPASSFTNHFN